MKVIFLDIDGVLNSRTHTSKLSRGLDMGNLDWWIEMIEPRLVPKINRITDATGAALVVSSTWRYALADRQLKNLLTIAGVTGRFVGATSHHCKQRGPAAIAWLDEHTPAAFVVLDDSDEGNSRFGERWICTQVDVGLTDADVDRAIELLGVA